jgi:hypothetical protein
MTAARVASPEGWQVSVRLVGGRWANLLGRVVWCGQPGVGGGGDSLVDGRVLGRSWASGPVLGGFVVGALVVLAEVTGEHDRRLVLNSGNGIVGCG